MCFWHVSNAVVHQLRLILTFLENIDSIHDSPSLYGFRSQLTYILAIYLIFKTSITMTNNMHKCIFDRPSVLNDKVFQTFRFWLLWSCFFDVHLFVVPLMILSRLHRFEKITKCTWRKNIPFFSFFLYLFSIDTLWKKEWEKSNNIRITLQLKPSLAFICLPQTNYHLYEC